jgi:hypothetical protein
MPELAPRRGNALYTLLMWQRLLVSLALAPLAFAQGSQIGGMIGRGGVARLFETSAYLFVAGVESCVLCGGRLGLFLEYHHWNKISSGTDSPTSLDLAGGGLRIQGKGERVRPFFDVGITGGVERDYRYVQSPGRASHAVAGGILGFGAAISVSEHWYLRPLARIVGLSTPEFGGFAGASVGYRF